MEAVLHHSSPTDNVAHLAKISSRPQKERVGESDEVDEADVAVESGLNVGPCELALSRVAPERNDAGHNQLSHCPACTFMGGSVCMCMCVCVGGVCVGSCYIDIYIYIYASRMVVGAG